MIVPQETWLREYAMSRVNRVGAASSSGVNVGIYDITDPLYGASTSKADNTSSIQAAIDAASSAGGGIVYVPEGTFNCNGTIYRKSNIWIEGDGPSSVLKLAGTATGLASVDKTDLSANAKLASAATSSFPLGPFISHALTGGFVSGGVLKNIAIVGNGSSRPYTKAYDNIFRSNDQ